MSYSCFHLYPMFNLAMMGERVGIDLWRYETADGRGMRRALDFLARYAGQEDKANWPFREIEPVEGAWWNPPRDQLPSVLYHAAIVYDNEHYKELAHDVLQDDWPEFRLHLMSGLVEVPSPVSSFLPAQGLRCRNVRQNLVRLLGYENVDRQLQSQGQRRDAQPGWCPLFPSAEGLQKFDRWLRPGVSPWYNVDGRPPKGAWSRFEGGVSC